MSANTDSLRPLNVPMAVGSTDPEFVGASYLDRMAIMLDRIRAQGLYHLVWAVGVVEEPFSWFEPRSSVGWDRFASDLHALTGRSLPPVAPLGSDPATRQPPPAN
ncbi:MAG: hypothetical protein ACOYEV_09470 [Candidatus Nanopelagicales bacterium]